MVRVPFSLMLVRGLLLLGLIRPLGVVCFGWVVRVLG